MTKVKKQFKFKIGADPEFVLTMQGRKVDARQTMELMLKGKEGLKYNESKSGFDCGEFGNIGWDGASSTAEIRPAAALDPKEVTNNIANMLREQFEVTYTYKFLKERKCQLNKATNFTDSLHHSTCPFSLLRTKQIST
jgi:hypothetical protein